MTAGASGRGKRGIKYYVPRSPDRIEDGRRARIFGVTRTVNIQVFRDDVTIGDRDFSASTYVSVFLQGEEEPRRDDEPDDIFPTEARRWTVVAERPTYTVIDVASSALIPPPPETAYPIRQLATQELRWAVTALRVRAICIVSAQISLESSTSDKPTFAVEPLILVDYERIEEE